MFVYLSILLFVVSALWLRNRNRPPGPWSLPIVGYLPWLDPRKPYKTLHDLSKRFGPIYGVYLGNIYTVVLSDVKIIKKVLSKDSTTGRAPLYLTHGLMKGYGLICAEGELWKDQRKFVHACLRRFGGTKIGSQKHVMEKLIRKYVQQFIDHVERRVLPSSFSASGPLRHALGSFMNEIVFGENWSEDDETWIYLQHLQEEGIKYIGIAGPLNFIPTLRFLPKFGKTIQFLTEGLQNTHNIYDSIIEKHQEILKKGLENDSSYEPMNFLESFLLERMRKKDSSDSKLYSDVQLKYLLADLFGAGLDTTLTTLNWYLLFMSVHRDIQKLVHEEIITVLNYKPATMEDFQQLPLFEASICESQRIRSTVPIGIPHGTLDDIEIESYVVPKNSMIIPLQWALHMDPDVWKNPDVFDPYRFIDENGRFSKKEEFAPFQVGKRMCVGEELAKMLLYHFSCAILQNYEMSVDDPENLDLEGICGITLTPKDVEIRFRKCD